MTLIQNVTFWLHLACCAAVIPDGSRLLPLNQLLEWFTPTKTTTFYAGLDEETIIRLVRRRLENAWRMKGRRCLRESLLCFYFLRLIGIPAVLNFGVFANPNKSEFAHCWVTVLGRSVTAPPEQQHVPILTYPAIGSESGCNPANSR